MSVPPDKSITHRALMLAPLARGETRIENFLDSATTRATLNCMRALGADIERVSPTTLVVRGRSLHSLREPHDVLFCAGSGTTMRLLAGLCAGQSFQSVLDGTAALRARPMARVIEPLRAMGATVDARDRNFAPLRIRGGNLYGIEYTLPVASAQVKSAILLAGLFADSATTVREPAPSRDHTERMLQAFGANADRLLPTAYCLLPPFILHPSSFILPNDFSSAAFFLVAGLLVAGSKLCLPGVGLNPTRTGLLDALTRMGTSLKIENAREDNGEPRGDLIVCAAEGLNATEVSGDEIPRLIDELPILAVAATQAQGETRVRDAAELRVKESDRIATLTQELRQLGAQIEELADGFTVAGPTRLRGARVSSHGDHRLAMSLAVAGLIAEGETLIEGWECVEDSFPNFPQQLSLITNRRSLA